MKKVLSIAGVIIAAAVVFGAGILVGVLNDGITVNVESSSSGGSNLPADNSGVNVDADVDVPSENETTEPITNEEGITVEVPKETQEDSSTKTTQENSGTKTTNPTTAAKEIMTKKEIVEYYNKAANKIKSEKAGFTKSFYRQIEGEENIKAVFGNIKGEAVFSVFTKNDEGKIFKPGKTKIYDEYPAAGFEWASKLTVDDIKNATIKDSGENYELYITIKPESNPQKGEASAHGRVMSVETESDIEGLATKIIDMDIQNMDYHDGYVKAVINKKTGKMVSAEISVTVDITGTGKGQELYVRDVKSTESFKDFIWA